MSAATSRRAFMSVAAMSGVLFAMASRKAVAANSAPQGEQSRPKGQVFVAIMVYPHMVALDFLGPMTVFKDMGYDISLVWKDKHPVANDLGLPIFADLSFAEVPSQVDILLVPGGTVGTTACMNDPEVLAFLQDCGSRARWVTSVCTGSLVLAAAGLLKGYDATSHWAVAGMLPLMGARHVDGRVVRDRNRLTGGGVTAGIDLGLTLAADISGEEAARQVQLLIEYAPKPPFDSGTPSQAGPQRTVQMLEMREPVDQPAWRAATAAGRRLGLA